MVVYGRSLLAALFFIPLLAGAVQYESSKLKIVFADPPKGMGIESISRKDTGETFWQAADPDPMLWEIKVTKAGKGDIALTVNNCSPSQRSSKLASDGSLFLRWEGITLGNTPEALSVTLKISQKSNGAIQWNVLPELKTDQYTFYAMDFPRIRSNWDSEKDKVLFPRGNFGHRLLCEPVYGTYPSSSSQLQFFGFFRPRGGLYLGCEDPNATHKDFQLAENGTFLIRTMGSNISVPGKSAIPQYPFVLAPVDTPLDACAQYRKWAEKQVWVQRGKLKNRSLSPAVQGTGLWLLQDLNYGTIVPSALREIAESPFPVATHLYNWNVHHFDTHYPEYFPARDTFADEVSAIQSAGGTVVPYLNARLWDTTLPSFAKISDESCMKADGTAYTETYGSGVSLAPMCPTSPAFRKKIAETADTLVQKYHVKGIYFDQVAAAYPILCFNPDHGHPLGGGGWWQEAYREFFKPITDQYESTLLMASENGAEPYIDSFTQFLLWSSVSQDDFPSLPAVYNQYAVYFCSPALQTDSQEAFAALQSRCLLWNIQPGWINYLHGPAQGQIPYWQWERDYIKQIEIWRNRLAPVIANGVMQQEVIFTPQPQPIPVTFHRSGDDGGTARDDQIPPFYGMIWRSDDGQTRAIAIAEVAGQTQQTTLCLPQQVGDWQLLKLEPDGAETILPFPEDKRLPITLAPFEIQAYLLRKN